MSIINIRQRKQHDVLDGFFAELDKIGFPKQAPLIVIKDDEPIISTRAKSHRVFIEDKINNGTKVTNKVKKLFEKKIKRRVNIITSQQWVCAYPAKHQGGRSRRNYFDGVIHRDVTNVPGILSCIVFHHNAQSGGIKIWFDSESYEKDSLDFQNHPSLAENHDIDRYLDRRFEHTVIEPKSNTAILFDGRLLHKSLSHNETYQRFVYSFFVCIGKSDPNDDMSYMTKGVQYEWVDSDTIQERTMESCEKMILRSSKKNETTTN